MVSIIIPVYNTELFLDECIASVVQQSYKDLEIILVNDGSTDSSGTICDNWKEKDHRIKVIHTPNQGQSLARNTGIRESIGEFLYFLDSDDILHPSAIEKMVKAITTTKTKIVVAGTMMFHEEKKEYETPQYSLASQLLTVKEYFQAMYEHFDVYLPFVISCGKLFDKRIFENQNCWFPSHKINEDNYTVHHHIVAAGGA